LNSLSPQQATVRLAISPHAVTDPALMAVKTPVGGAVSPDVLSPQQVMVPLACIPHA
jgi:hypothetical protein